MVRKWKYWLSAAAVLLMVGAGCGEAVQQQTSVEGQVQPPQPAAQVDAQAGTKAEAQDNGPVNVDSAVDAAIKESDDDASASMEANGDADVLNNDSADLNAYGQAYVDSETR